MRKRREAKRGVEEEREREGRKVPGSRPTNRFSFAAVVIWIFCIFTSSLLIVLKKAMGRTTT